MKKIIGIVAAILAGQLLAGTAHAFECKECHSKNPVMVRMHKALEGRSCFACHKMGEKLMGKSQPKDRNSLLQRRTTDPACVECHKK